MPRQADGGEMSWSPEASEYRQIMGRAAKDPEVDWINGWLLPGERVVGVVSGTEGALPSRFILTPLHLIYLHVGMQMTYSVFDLDEVSGYQAVPKWATNVDMNINTTRGALSFGNIHEREIAPFTQALQRFWAPFGPGGVLETASGALDAISPLVDLLTNPETTLLPLLPAGLTPLQLIGRDARTCCIIALGNDQPTFEQAWILWVLTSNAGDPLGESGPGAKVRGDIAQVRAGSPPPFLLANIDREAVGERLKAWRASIDMLMGVVEGFVRLGSVDCWAPQLQRAAQIGETLSKSTMGSSAGQYEAVLAELNALLGLDAVKAEIQGLANLIRVQAMREQQGLSDGEAMSRHLVFTGNPGTGKTTVARLVGKLYQALGVLPSGHLVEASRSDLVGGYVGQTAIKTQEIFQQARGGVLFIDEAYSLSRAGSDIDYGQEAIDTLVKLMEDHRGDTAVIAAGYPAEMESFLSSNPGLRSRFSRIIGFPDYTNEELLEIVRRTAERKSYHLTPDAISALSRYLDSVPRGHGFGNGRVARQALEDAILRQAGRLAGLPSPSAQQLATIELSDVPLALAAVPETNSAAAGWDLPEWAQAVTSPVTSDENSVAPAPDPPVTARDAWFALVDLEGRERARVLEVSGVWLGEYATTIDRVLPGISEIADSVDAFAIIVRHLLVTLQGELAQVPALARSAALEVDQNVRLGPEFRAFVDVAGRASNTFAELGKTCGEQWEPVLPFTDRP